MSATPNFTRQIKRSIGPLLKSRGFQLVNERADPEHFGDALAVFESPFLRLKFTQDRGEVFVDVAENGSENEWHQLRDVLALCRPIFAKAGGVDLEKINEDLIAPSSWRNDMPSVARVLEKKLPMIESRFRPESVAVTRTWLKAIEQREERTVVDRIFGRANQNRSKSRSIKK